MKRRAFLFVLTAALAFPALAQTKPLKIGIIGSGRIGSTFGGLWAKAGHEIMFSDRDAEQAHQQPVHLHARMPVEAAIEDRRAGPWAEREVSRTGHRVMDVSGELALDVAERHPGVSSGLGAQQFAPFGRQVHDSSSRARVGWLS